MANRGSTFLALITGAAIGAGLGMLYAPDSGDKTRKKIGDNARKAQDNINRQYRETTTNLTGKAGKARADFQNKLDDTLSSVSSRADEIFNSLEAKLDELRRQNSRFKKKDRLGEDENKEKVETPESDVIKPSTDNAIV